MRRALIRWSLPSVLVLALAIQVIPYGRSPVNPLLSQEPAWDGPQIREITVRACYDCHSNQTVWPWYAHIAPISWLIQSDVDEGRKKLNFSVWDRPQRKAHESGKAVRKGEMPPWYYTALHPQARLSAAERQTLIQGLETMFGHQQEQRTERR
jgi:mono/diheme cytochrome c family protein